MKQFFSLLMAAVLLCTLVACGSKDSGGNDGDGITIAPSVSENSMAGHLWDAFLQEVTTNEGVTMEELADTLVRHPLIRFEGMSASVEPGLLAGFDNYEVTGFRSGAMFAPAIGSIAFIGYVFELEDGVDAQGFVSGLSNNANLRWLVCIPAGQLAVGAHGNIVFFVMCPGGAG